jgi:hypothetical protein
MSYVIVGNVMNTSRRPRCGDGSWTNHYFALSGSQRYVCAILHCGNSVEVGAHVRATNIGRWDEFILPLCQRCNASPAYMYVKRGVALVSANQQRAGCYRPFAD